MGKEILELKKEITTLKSEVISLKTDVRLLKDVVGTNQKYIDSKIITLENKLTEL